MKNEQYTVRVEWTDKRGVERHVDISVTIGADDPITDVDDRAMELFYERFPDAEDAIPSII